MKNIKMKKIKEVFSSFESFLDVMEDDYSFIDKREYESDTNYCIMCDNTILYAISLYKERISSTKEIDVMNFYKRFSWCNEEIDNNIAVFLKETFPQYYLFSSNYCYITESALKNAGYVMTENTNPNNQYEYSFLQNYFSLNKDKYILLNAIDIPDMKKPHTIRYEIMNMHDFKRYIRKTYCDEWSFKTWRNSCNVSSLFGFRYTHPSTQYFKAQYLVAIMEQNNKEYIVGIISFSEETGYNNYEHFYLSYIEISYFCQGNNFAKTLVSHLNPYVKGKDLVLSRMSDCGSKHHIDKIFVDNIISTKVIPNKELI